MSPGWLLPPFSELVLSSLSRLFMAGRRHGPGVHTWVTGGCLPLFPAPAASFCPAALLGPWPRGCAADLGNAVHPFVKWEAGDMQKILKKGTLTFSSFLSLLLLIYKYQASMLWAIHRAGPSRLLHAKLIEFRDGPPSPMVWWKLERSISQGLIVSPRTHEDSVRDLGA